MSAPIEIWASEGYELAEGARLVGDRVVFVDILSGRLLEAPVDRGAPARLVVQLDVPLGAVAPVADDPGAWIAAAGTGIALIAADGSVKWIDRPEDASAVESRMNDGACDPYGRFWAGSMAYDATPGAASLYRVNPDGTVVRALDSLTIVNGPAFDAAGDVLYIADTPTGRIFRYGLDASGSLAEGGVWVEVPAVDGAPDGMTVDDQGRLWVALWGGSRVHCYDTDGSLAHVLAVPARQPTSVCFGRAGRLFISTAAHGLGDPGPADGALLCARVAASARPAQAFGGPR